MGFTNQFLADGGAEFLSGLKWLIVVLVSIAGSFCVIYAVYIGYLFATATDDGKRRAAKNRLIKVVSSGLIIVGLALCMNAIDVTFSSPVTENNNNEDDPFSGLEQVSAPFGYKTETDRGSMKTIKKDVEVEFVVYMDRICTGTNKSSFNSALFKEFTGDFEFVDVNDSNLSNILLVKEPPKQVCKVVENGKKLIYRYQPNITSTEAVTLLFYDCKGAAGKYWKANVGCMYDGNYQTIECFFRINDETGFINESTKFAKDPIGTFVLYE